MEKYRPETAAMKKRRLQVSFKLFNYYIYLFYIFILIIIITIIYLFLITSSFIYFYRKELKIK